MKSKIMTIITLVFLLSGCGNNINNQKIVGNISMSQNTTAISENSNIHIKDNNDKIVNEESKTRAEKISKKIKEISNIKDVSVVISEKFALIGIELYNNMSDKNLIILKNNITTLVKNCDNSINQVSVTATPTLVKRITDKSDFSTEDIKPTELSGSHRKLIELTPGF